jgi:hypothetical protein
MNWFAKNCFDQCNDFEYNEDIIFLKENYRRYNSIHIIF